MNYTQRIAELEIENERYREVLERISKAFGVTEKIEGSWAVRTNHGEFSTDSFDCLEQVVAIAQEALNPPDEWEEVELEAYQCSNCGWTVTKNVTVKCCAMPHLVKLTGSYKRKKPKKVKRREEIGEVWSDSRHMKGISPFNLDSVPEGAKVYCEWEVEG